MKRQAWTLRLSDDNAEEVDKTYRMKIFPDDLPAGLPVPAWKRETDSLVEISSEQFPGSRPVWLWEA